MGLACSSTLGEEIRLPIFNVIFTWEFVWFRFDSVAWSFLVYLTTASLPELSKYRMKWKR